MFQWGVKTHQAKPIEMGWNTLDKITKNTQDAGRRNWNVGWCHAHMFLMCGSTAETGQHAHNNSLCQAFNLKPWIWLEQTRGHRDTHMHTGVWWWQGQQARQGLTPCDYFTLVNCCKCRRGEARMKLLWTRCRRQTFPAFHQWSPMICLYVYMCTDHFKRAVWIYSGFWF